MLYEEVEVGKTYVSNIKKPITGSEIDFVTQLSGLDHPGFLDAEFAKTLGFKDRATPGFYILGAMMGLLYKGGFLADAAIWTGSTNLSFKTPVFPGDTISAEAKVVSKRATRRFGLVTYDWTIRNQRDEVVATGTNT
jgi:acyl dehydratase